MQQRLFQLWKSLTMSKVNDKWNLKLLKLRECFWTIRQNNIFTTYLDLLRVPRIQNTSSVVAATNFFTAHISCSGPYLSNLSTAFFQGKPIVMQDAGMHIMRNNIAIAESRSVTKMYKLILRYRCKVSIKCHDHLHLFVNIFRSETKCTRCHGPSAF